MASVVRRQIDAVGLVVGGQHDAADVEDVMFAQVLLVDAKHVGRRGEVGLHMVVELEAVYFAHVLRFGDPEHDALEEAIEASERLLR